MVKFYSYSKINTFEQCPKKFQFKYIDKITPLIEKSIEAHLGSCVHATLEWLYIGVKEKKIPSVEELIQYYSDQWEKDYTENILIVNETMSVKDYFNRGIEFLVPYYMEHHPFDDHTIEVEKKIIITLAEKIKIQGFIDRLTYNLKTKEYEIHDYKTANTLPTLEKLEKDRQLALYSIAIKELLGKDKGVKLVWHFLAHNKKVHIKKSNDQLEKIREETVELIKKIESTKEFNSVKSILCNWCEYKNICPAWGNSLDESKTEEKKEDLSDIDKYPTLKKYIRD